jgi:hypothetical protein
MPPDPIEDASEAEFATVHGAVDEFVSFFCPYLDVETIAPQEDVSGSEGNSLVAIEKAVIVAQRLHQSGRFFLERVVIAGLGPEVISNENEKDIRRLAHDPAGDDPDFVAYRFVVLQEMKAWHTGSRPFARREPEQQRLYPISAKPYQSQTGT